jgi:hypothetical protein
MENSDKVVVPMPRGGTGTATNDIDFGTPVVFKVPLPRHTWCMCHLRGYVPSTRAFWPLLTLENCACDVLLMPRLLMIQSLLRVQDLTYTVKSNTNKGATVSLLKSISGCFSPRQMSALVRPCSHHHPVPPSQFTSASCAKATQKATIVDPSRCISRFLSGSPCS